MMDFEHRKDDVYIHKNYQKEFDEEPPAPQIDYHAPSTNKLNTKPTAP
jgi:hypothetical protein